MKNVLHIGAESGEIDFYHGLGTRNLVYIEPDHQCLEKLYSNIEKYQQKAVEKKIMNIKVIPKACSTFSGQSLPFYANGKGQSSFLNPSERTLEIVGKDFNKYNVDTISLTDILHEFEDIEGFDYLCIDTQGHELEILKPIASKDLLDNFMIIDIEIMTDPMQYVIDPNNWRELVHLLVRYGYEPVIHPQGITESYLFFHPNYLSLNRTWLCQMIENVKNELVHELLAKQGLDISFNSQEINRYSAMGDQFWLPFAHIPGSIHASLLDRFRKKLIRRISIKNKQENQLFNEEGTVIKF